MSAPAVTPSDGSIKTPPTLKASSLTVTEGVNMPLSHVSQLFVANPMV
jgi:hypothetical protein